jgi:hypothetical protein
MWKSFKLFLAGVVLVSAALATGCSQNSDGQARQDREPKQHIHGSGGGHHDE